MTPTFPRIAAAYIFDRYTLGATLSPGGSRVTVASHRLLPILRSCQGNISGEAALASLGTIPAAVTPVPAAHFSSQGAWGSLFVAGNLRSVSAHNPATHYTL